MDIRKGEKVMVTELQEHGFTFEEKIGSSKVWKDGTKRIFINNKSDIVEQIVNNNGVEESTLSKIQRGDLSDIPMSHFASQQS